MTQTSEKLNNEDMEEIATMGMVIVAKALDEIEPSSNMITTQKLALASFACSYAAKHFEHCCITADKENTQ